MTHPSTVADTLDAGWVEWTGGDCPIPEGAGCQVQYRDGFISPEKAALNIRRSAHIWAHMPEMRGFDIIAYRLVQP